MPDANDMALTREYTDRGSETAFAELVHRHINLVYSVALRYTGNSPDAQDVTQAVFIILAQKAASLRQRTTLTGWLYETTRFTARQVLRTRNRQQAREQEAYMESTLNDSNTENLWRQLAPILEDAMSRLNEKERTLLALRFFENKSGAETAALLGIQEWAAHKRAARALEKLRKFFMKSGVNSTASIIAGEISANSVQTAPVLLAKTTTAVALAKGATASLSTLTLIKGALKLMAWTKAKSVVIVACACMLFVAGTATVLVEKHIQARQFAPAYAPWSDAGASSPKAALQSLAWALTHEDYKRARELIQWDETGETNAGLRWVQQEATLKSVLAPALKNIESFRILSIERTKDPNEALVKIEKQFQNKNIVPFAVTAKLRRVGNQWRVVANLEYHLKSDGSGSVTMRLPFTDSFE